MTGQENVLPWMKVDHVDDGEGGDGDAGERLHFDARAIRGANTRLDLDMVVGEDEVDLDRKAHV